MKKRIIATLAGLATLTAAAAALAATPVITDVSGGGTTAPHNSYQIKYIAYEMYNNITGVNSNNVEFFARLGGDVSTGDSVNIKGYNADVNLGSGNLFLLGVADNVAINSSALGAANVAANNFTATANGAVALVGRATAGTVGLGAGQLCNAAVTGFNSPAAVGYPAMNYVVIGDSNATGVQNQVTMLGADLTTFCRLNTGDSTIGSDATNAGLVATDKVIAMTPTGLNTYVSTAQGTLSNSGTDIGRVIPSVSFALNLYVNANLNPSCTIPKDIQLHLVTNQETINPTTVLQIIPQFVASQSATALQQELSTNDDFKKFIDASNNTYAQFNRSLGFGGNLYSLLDRHFTVAVANTYQGMFRSFVPQTANASLDFQLTSLSAQAGVGMTYYNWVPASVACTKDATNKIFSCSTGTGTTLQLTTPGVAAANGAAGTSNALNISNGAATLEMTPTSWSTTAFNFKINGVQDVCVTAAGSVGNWYGGIEAIVPIVKQGNGYETYIKLFNRYTKSAKLYVANMNKISDSIVTSITQLAAPNDAIAPASVVTISGADLQANADLGISAGDMAFGLPVKFLIRVPAQAGSPAFTTFEDTLNTLGPVGALSNSAAGVATASVVDPYITGVVVQVVPGGSQRSISLMFKSFKQGQYQVN